MRSLKSCASHAKGDAFNKPFATNIFPVLDRLHKLHKIISVISKQYAHFKIKPEKLLAVNYICKKLNQYIQIQSFKNKFSEHF